MNAIDILTEIIRNGGGSRRGGDGERSQPSPGGKGVDVFSDIFGRRTNQRGSVAPPPSESEIERQARELEDMLGVGREKPGAPPAGQSAPDRPETDWGRAIPPASRETRPRLPEAPAGDPVRIDAEAQVLIRAMINAAKADGWVTRDEQQAIVKQLGDASREAIDFLEREIHAQLDVRDFAWSVPLGMETKVYAISLAAIDLDTRAESAYLDDLAHGLRLPREARTQIHQRYGVPLPS